LTIYLHSVLTPYVLAGASMVGHWTYSIFSLPLEKDQPPCNGYYSKLC